MPFDTQAWLNTPGIRELSPEMRGIYLDLLCLMWAGDQRGVLIKPNQELYTRNEIKRLLGISEVGWIDQLIETGLIARRDDGALYSRHILRGEEIRAKRREAGLKGGNATKAKHLAPKVEKAPDPPAKPPKDPVLPLEIEDPPQSPPDLTPAQKVAVERKRKYQYADDVTLTRDEYAKLCEAHTEAGAKRMIEILSNYKGSKGKRYKSDYKAILNWVVDRYNQELLQNGISQRQSERAPAYPGGGSAYNTRCPATTIQADPTKGGGGTPETPPDYSERL